MKNINEIQGNCSGCSGCISICPVNAIDYKLNKEGFYHAIVNEEKCIHCGMCAKVCCKNLETINLPKLTKGKLLSAYSKDELTLKECTSGGIAFELAKKAIEEGYKVIGVVYNYQKDIAESIIIDKIEELEKTKSSKYIQSKADIAYKNVINLCKENKNNKFIIFGTPCQIFGIRKSIETLHLKNSIVYIDLFCHGVPSYLVWNTYINSIKKKNNIKNFSKINFRDKKLGWHNFVLTMTGENKKQIVNKAERDEFYKIFFDNILLNRSCTNCELRKNFSASDIRLGDYWGKKYKTNLKGISAVEIFTDEGIKFFDKISDKIAYKEEKELQDFLKYQSTENYGNEKLYNEAIESLKKGENLSKIIKKYRKQLNKKYILKQKIKIGVSYLPSSVKNSLRKIL